MIKIQKGHRYKCIKDFIMDDGKFCYKAGEIYLSEKEDCLTDTYGSKNHYMSCVGNDDFFVECTDPVIKWGEVRYDGPAPKCMIDNTESVKNDRLDDKLMWELLPLQDIEDIVKVYTAGAKKYGPDRWQNLPDGYKRYKAAMFRHLLEHEKGNEIDEETGCLHIAQVAWNAIALLHFVKEEMKNKIIEQVSKK